MKIDLFQVDAFAATLFEGNPAAVCPLERWIPDELMQQIAMENNLSETAFFVEEQEVFNLRWFTPQTEVDLCGHATLATAHVLFNHLDFDAGKIVFDTKSGELTVKRENDRLVMNFPVSPVEPATLPHEAAEALGTQPLECYRGTDYLLVLQNEQAVRKLSPDFSTLANLNTRGIIVTAPADAEEIDFVSRFFAPAVGIDEDPVTGSAHTTLVPYWADRFEKQALKARQVSRRGGTIECTLLGDRVELAGQAQTFFATTIELDDSQIRNADS